MALTHVEVENNTASRSVLLVEDSSVTQDIVQLVLQQAGHRVLIAETGEDALSLLAAEDFDVVLMDFHLPDINGLQVVQSHLASGLNIHRPHFIAVTGDVRGLLADKLNCEVFDRIVPKPIDIDLICSLVETLDLAPKKAATPKLVARSHPFAELPFAFLKWPTDQGSNLTPGLIGFDAILIQSTEALPLLWQQSGANLLPIIDLTGTLGTRADFDAGAPGLDDEERLTILVDQFKDLHAEIHPDIIKSNDPADRVLARLHLAGGSLKPTRGGEHRSMIQWNTIADSDDLETAISKLEKEGFLETRFFERVHHCPKCKSARLLIREECHACESANLTEESYLHHFRCAYQGPESDFRQGDELICPKCRRTLGHFGQDYDRPGTTVKCNSCSELTTEPMVAFVCVDCAARTSADATPTRDVSMGEVTEAGRAYLKSGQAFFGATRQTLRFADLPLELIIALNKAASQFNETKAPFVLGYIAYDNLDAVRSEHGARQTAEARSLWLENLQQTLSGKPIIAKGTANDFFLVTQIDKPEMDGSLPQYKGHCDASVRLDLGARFTTFGPKDITA